jgi:hypothetical protein
MAASENDDRMRSMLVTAAESYDKLAVSLMSILRTRARLAA